MTTYLDPWPAPRARGPVEATVSLPGSKSLTNRALVLAAIADGPSVVRRALRSRDTSLMAVALTSLGARVDTTGDDWAVTPGVFDRDAVVDCGLAVIDRSQANVGNTLDVAVGDGTVPATVDVLPIYDTEKKRPRS